MNKVYNTQKNIASKIEEFLKKAIPDIRKTQLKIIPFIIIGMIIAESVVVHDIAKDLKDDFAKVQLESVIKRIKRFFTNKLFQPYVFYDKIIRVIISKFKSKHKDKRVHIIFDHMFSRESFTVFMITMRIGSIGIPLWFRCFKGTPTDAFQEELIMSGITYVSELFGADYDLIFLADRWFGSVKITKHIDRLGHTYCMRLKKNITVEYYDTKNENWVKTTAGKLESYKHNATKYMNVRITKDRYETNIVVSKTKDVKEPWIIVTNKDIKHAIKNYKKRFGGIECVFKNQKSNGFYLECTVNASLKYFESMYTMVCFATLFLTMIGTDYSKNSKSYDNKIQTHKVIKGCKRRVKTLFNVGLTLFHICFNSDINIRLPLNFILYDV